ncbi:MAG: ABC transporter ATP-binding protein [Oscillospiraceae bacterium]|jgi:branched-chain amino acid transport system ATP-binding protein
MIQVNNIDVSYGPVQALHHVSVEISQDQAVAIIGSNGAGKTTLMKSIVGLCKPSNGAILFDGEPIHTLATHEIIRKGIVLVPEGRKIFPKLTVRSNLEMGAYTRKGAIEHSIEEIFTYFPRLKERMNQLAGTLSGGEQQMLAIGRGLMAEPKLLMLDEPSMGLAPVIVEEMFTIINRIHKERRLPILLVEQNAYMALETCDYCYVIENGEIVLEGTSEQMEASEEIKKVYLGG